MKDIDVRLGGAKPFDAKLVKRAKKIGFKQEQIDVFSTEKDLKEACDRLKPDMSTNLPATEKRVQPPAPKIEGKPAVATVTIKLPVKRAQHVVRCTYEEQHLVSFLNLNKIRNVQRVAIVREYEPDKFDDLNSTMIINYKEQP